MLFSAEQIEGPWRPVGGWFGHRLAGLSAGPGGVAHAVGQHGTVVATDDAGATWRALPSGTHKHLIAVARSPRGPVYALSRRGLLASVDGKTWKNTALSLEEDAIAVCASDDAVVVLTGDNTVHQGDPAGERWRAYPTGAAAPLAALKVAADGSLLAAGEGGLLLGAPAAAGPWERAKNPSKSGLRVLAIGADGVAWAAGNRGTLLRSFNGKTWARVALPTRADIETLWAGQSLLLVGTNKREILASRDGGATWTTWKPDDLVALCGWGERDEGLALSSFALYRFRADQGLEAEHRLVNGAPSALCAMPSGKLWGFSSHGAARCDDREGQTWTIVAGDEDERPRSRQGGNALSKAHDGREVALGEYHAIFLTEDGGQRWKKKNIGQKSIHAVAHGPGGALCAVEWMASHDAPCVLHLRDRSGTWSSRPAEVCDWPSCFWSPAGPLWLVGHEGILQRSDDNGASFRTVEWGREKRLAAGEYWAGKLTAIGGDEGLVLVACSLGWLLRSDDGERFEQVELPGRDYVRLISLLPDGTALLQGERHLYLSRDRGRTFSQVVVGDKIKLAGVQQAPSGRWLALASAPT